MTTKLTGAQVFNFRFIDKEEFKFIFTCSQVEKIGPLFVSRTNCTASIKYSRVTKMLKN